MPRKVKGKKGLEGTSPLWLIKVSPGVYELKKMSNSLKETKVLKFIVRAKNWLCLHPGHLLQNESRRKKFVALAISALCWAFEGTEDLSVTLGNE